MCAAGARQGGRGRVVAEEVGVVEEGGRAVEECLEVVGEARSGRKREGEVWRRR